MRRLEADLRTDPTRSLRALAFSALTLAACGNPGPGPPPLDATLPLHLEEHLDAAVVTGSQAPADLPAELAWHFDEPQPGWQPAAPLDPNKGPPEVTPAADALRVTLTEANRRRRGFRGGVFVDMPAGSNREDWAYIAIRARTAEKVGFLTAWYNRRLEAGDMVFDREPFVERGERMPVVTDGAEHRYLLRADWADFVTGDGSWRQLGLVIDAREPAGLDLLSVELIPKEARFATAGAGVASEPRDEVHRRTIFTHAPARLDYRIRLPEDGRLDFALGVLRRDAPILFRVTVDDGGSTTAFEESFADPTAWAQRSVDLRPWGGKTVTLGLESECERPGTVALWASPTVSAARTAEPPASAPPNVILYVIDAGGAEYASAYGYERRTTPNLERLAAEGALFESAWSNSTWSKPSTTSFMTSLQHSVLGGYRAPSDPLPEAATTMAQYLHRTGYQTAVFTSNTWCGTMSGLERGVDVLRETISGINSTSSTELHESFWHWRRDYPGEPFWVHFQTTDVHWPWEPVAPVAGTFMSPARRAAFEEMERKIGAGGGGIGRAWALRAPRGLFERAGVDRREYFEAVRDAFDEAMLFNDRELGRFVDELKASGEWQRTLFIVTADHGDWPGLGLLPDLDPAEDPPYLNPYLTRVPLVVVWPGHVPPGLRPAEPVSLLDLLPTVLEAAGQPLPDSLQGQSLMPLLTGKPGWETRPVVIDEFNVDPATGRMSGRIEMIDGTWGASLAIDQGEDEIETRLVLCDLATDRYCLRDLAASRPDLARSYRERLLSAFRDHLDRAKRYPRSATGSLSAEQIRTLRSLGYL